MKWTLGILILIPIFTGAQVITTIAGNGIAGYSGDGYAATLAELNGPNFVLSDASGNLFISEWGNSCIRKVNSSGIISTIAGTGVSGYSGDGGPATLAQLSQPVGIALDRYGNLFIADDGNNRIRRIDTNGRISTFAGTGTEGYNGDGIQASMADLRTPQGVAIDAVGNLYISDEGNERIRKVNSSGIISTIGGTGVQGYSGDGGPATLAEFAIMEGIAVDGLGNIYIADNWNARVREISSSGIVNTMAGNGSFGYSGDGEIATNAVLGGPDGVAVDNFGNVYIAIGGEARVRRVDAQGIATIAGTGISGYNGDRIDGTAAELNGPTRVSVDSDGNIYIADDGNNRIRFMTRPTSTDVNLINQSSLMEVYPNPATASLTISSTDKITSTTITNLLGQTVYTQSYNSPQVNVDVSTLPPGMYLVKINGTKVRKFVKQ